MNIDAEEYSKDVEFARIVVVIRRFLVNSVKPVNSGMTRIKRIALIQRKLHKPTE